MPLISERVWADRIIMDPIVFGAMFMGSLSLGVVAARGVLGLVFHLMILARPRQDAPAARR